MPLCSVIDSSFYGGFSYRSGQFRPVLGENLFILGLNSDSRWKNKKKWSLPVILAFRCDGSTKPCHFFLAIEIFFLLPYIEKYVDGLGSRNRRNEKGFRVHRSVFWFRVWRLSRVLPFICGFSSSFSTWISVLSSLKLKNGMNQRNCIY